MMVKAKKAIFVTRPKTAAAKTKVSSATFTAPDNWRKNTVSQKKKKKKNADHSDGQKSSSNKKSMDIHKLPAESHSAFRKLQPLISTTTGKVQTSGPRVEYFKTKLHPRGHHKNHKKKGKLKTHEQQNSQLKQGLGFSSVDGACRTNLLLQTHTPKAVKEKKMDSVCQTRTQMTSLSQSKTVQGSPLKESTSPPSATEGSQSKHKKRRKAVKKNPDGTSNWMKLCMALNIDPAARKTKPLKRPAEDSNHQAKSPEPKRAKQGIWFDNVDKILIETDTDRNERVDGKSGNVEGTKPDASDALVKPESFKGLTKCVAMDCEMVGVGPKGEESILARVSIVNHFGVCLYDKFVLPREKVTDYRTFVSGVTEENLATGEEFTKVQKEVSDVIRGRILVGHAVHNDLKVLFLTHPHKMIRDTSQYKPFRELFAGRIPSLKKLTDKVLGVSVQEGQHSSVQDAQATMRLYTMYRQRWEKELKKKRRTDKKKKKKTKKKN